MFPPSSIVIDNFFKLKHCYILLFSFTEQLYSFEQNKISLIFFFPHAFFRYFIQSHAVSFRIIIRSYAHFRPTMWAIIERSFPDREAD